MARRTPPINATVTRVTYSEYAGYDQPDAEIERWAGQQPAYVSESVTDETDEDWAPRRVLNARIVIPSTVPVKVRDGIQFTRQGVEHTHYVDVVEDRSDYGFTRCHVRKDSP